MKNETIRDKTKSIPFVDRYILGDKGESSRLDYQNSHPHYRLENELSQNDCFAFDGMRVLDAGCGNADYSRKLVQSNPYATFKVDAYDQSEERLEVAMQKAERASLSGKINFIQGKLENIQCPDEHYDRVFTRFTFQHLYKTHQQVADEYFRVLKTGGELIIIDANGVLLDIFSENQKLTDYLSILRPNLKIDLHICQKLEKILEKAGFRNISVDISDMDFISMADRRFERQIYEKRFEQSRTALSQVFEKGAYDDFAEIFLDEIINPETKVCYKKYIFRAVK